MASDGEKRTAAMEPVVLYPSPGMGHLISMIELGKLLVCHGLPVTILIVDPPYNTGSTAPFIARVSSANPSVTFHRLPAVSLPPTISSTNHEALAFEVLRLSNPYLHDILLSSPARALIVDFFCACVLDLAAEASLPCYCFYTSGAGALACFLNFPALDSRISASFKDLGTTLIDIPGVPPIPADHMPLPMLDNSDDAYKGFLELARSLFKYDGIMVNTFSSLESTAVKAITDGLCAADGSSTPPIYCVGPLITSEGRAQSGRLDCLSWLDSQPEGSVVFLCFGSLGLFSADQLKEIAIGVEQSGHRFLWVVRSPPTEDPAKRFEAPPEPDLDALLPEGFLQRTSDQGLVVKSWAPQVEVLRHRAVGGFVTHCGWNSVLEAICSGVAMIAWPLYAEQRWNKVFLVEEMKLAVEMRGFESGLVRAEEVETRIKWLMESEEGKELKQRTVAAKEAATVAVKEGGTSYEALEQLVKAWKRVQRNREGTIRV